MTIAPETKAGAQSAGPSETFYRSVDSAPAGVSVNRPNSVVNGFLIGFTATTILALAALTLARSRFAYDIPIDLVFFTADRANVILPVRTFFLIFFVIYAAYAYGPVSAKLRLGSAFVLKLAALCVLIDGMAFISWRWFAAVWPIHLQQLLAGLGALAIFPHTVLGQARLPLPSGSPITRRGKPWEVALLVLPALVAAAAALIVATVYEDAAGYLRSVALLGGMGPGVFLAQQIFTLQLGGIGFLRNARSRRRDFAPPVAVLIPAHNESHQIIATLAGVDAAAGEYDGPVRVIIVDNCSNDDTADLARQSLRSAQNMIGGVVACDTPGKAKALNFGLNLVDEDFVVRIDADTIIEPKALAIAMRHFANEEVGVVGGLPLPHRGSGALGRVRAIEVILRHGFVQVALGAFNGILGIPGMFAIYRKSVVDAAGGITEGMNGEDTDIVLRMTNLGYRAVSEPLARFRTEVPATLHHLREQRTRWFRSLYHVSAHNRAMLLREGLVTGMVVMPFTLLNGARRAMMTPLVIYGAIIFFMYGGVYSHPDFQTVIAVVVGMPFLMAVFVCALWRRFDLLPYIPFYMGFRLLRSYYTLAATLTLIYPAKAEDRAFVAAKPRQGLIPVPPDTARPETEARPEAAKPARPAKTPQRREDAPR